MLERHATKLREIQDDLAPEFLSEIKRDVGAEILAVGDGRRWIERDAYQQLGVAMGSQGTGSIEHVKVRWQEIDQPMAFDQSIQNSGRPLVIDPLVTSANLRVPRAPSI